LDAVDGQGKPSALALGAAPGLFDVDVGEISQLALDVIEAGI
jgi:hypothetical protein